MDTVHKIGRRKTAVARIYLSEGKGDYHSKRKRLQKLLYYRNFTI